MTCAEQHDQMQAQCRLHGNNVLAMKAAKNALVCGLLQGIHWSTDTVFQQTMHKAKALCLAVAPEDTLPTLQDIDNVQVCYLDHLQNAVLLTQGGFTHLLHTLLCKCP